jgi:ferredoxin
MKIRIAADACTGCEDCTEAYPSLFKLGSNWIAEPVQETVPRELEPEACKTAMICQFEAIKIQE